MADLSGIGLTNFIWFISVSILFLLFNYWITMSNTALVGMFCGITGIIQWGLNSAATQNALVCGKSNPGIAFLYTLIPWVLIVLVGNIFLFAFPGWVRVFANTFGMWISYKALYTPGIRDNSSTTTSTDAQYVKIFNEIKQNPQIIINEIDIIGKEENTEEINKIFESYKSVYPTIFGNNKDDIIKIIKFKNKIGYIIWNILFGLIAVMVSTNSLLNSGCSASII